VAFSGKQIAAMHAKDHAVGHGPLPGHEYLTMHDQMRALNLSSQPHTSAVHGGVMNPRREFLKNRIQYHVAGGHVPNQDFSGENFAGKPTVYGGHADTGPAGAGPKVGGY
jgi:hypothetical protein